MENPKAYVHLAYGIDADKYREQYRSGQVPDETPYGFHHAASMGFRVSFSVDHPESRAGRLLRRALTRLLGFDLLHAYRNHKQIEEADVVWTMEEIEFLAVCALSSRSAKRRPRLIAQTIWLFNNWQSYSAARRSMLRRLLERADLITVHSREYLALAPSLIPGLTPHLLPFGISLDSFPHTEPKRCACEPGVLKVLSMGNDPTRDWTTLLAAFGNDARFDLRIVAGKLKDETIAGYSNVTCPRNPGMEAFRDLYRWADLVVVPMVSNRYSGITVALEATSMGVPVVSSRTGGVPTYFNEREVLYVEPQDAQALREAVLSWTPAHMTDQVVRAQARFLQEDYSSRGMARRYVDLSADLLAQG